MVKDYMIHKYLINTSNNNAEVQLIDGTVIVPANGGWIGVTKLEYDHPDTIQALRKNWVKESTKQPETPAEPEGAPVKLEEAAPAGSKTPPKREKVEAKPA